MYCGRASLRSAFAFPALIAPGASVSYLKVRVFGMVLIPLSGGGIYYNWWQLRHTGSYYMKLAAFGPVIAIGGVFLIVFPRRGGKPTSNGEKLVAMIVLAIGLVVGVINVYLMDPGVFGR